MEEAKKVSEHLLNKKLIACVNYFPIESAFWWNDKIDKSNEIVSLVKSRKENWDKIKDEVKKVAHHGIRLGTEDSYQFMKSMKGIKRVYDKRRMTKLKEGYRRHCNPRSWIEQSFTLTAAEDGKRVYDEKFVSMEELRSDNTLSIPLQYALNNRDLTE